jgi:hypothetical protein
MGSFRKKIGQSARRKARTNMTRPPKKYGEWDTDARMAMARRAERESLRSRPRI